ncbi:hypothetical protein EIN_485600 [Entamoeba invadens IP1]|uniref:non-specific serine/threonine protein kinase n=1 Tax=Entamoeba invadens IP1 TaxID=370355 RepID=A0A0A1UAF0_ENTIV|nr:hypothetical protein EIN_485600 [Entamoeba invadens IP1]ELP89168.1 hypothetical protein EIN_485600 [Entamoeba invadens IP1]|eukprot:XP_004255939.1 hypothetical protein EIN_485600 [Entamoeba invadens IP1]
MMFLYDSTGEGRLTYEDFLELICYVSDLKTRCEQSQKDKMKESDSRKILPKIRCSVTETPDCNLAPLTTPSLPETSKSPTPAVFSMITPSDSPAPGVTPGLNPATLLQMPPNSVTPTPGAKGEVNVSQIPSQEMSLLWSLFDQEMKHRFLSVVENTQKYKAFTCYLFNLTDTKKDGKIDIEDLEFILEVLYDDGITIENLLYECPQSRPQSVEEEAQMIFQTYSYKNKSFLCQAEFSFLANMIMKNYRLKAEGNSIRLVGDYELQRKLGEGSEGCVRLAINRRTGEKKAIKIFNKNSQINLEHLENEISSLRKLNHPNIVRLDEVIENDDQLYFVMELCPGGSLAEHIAIAPFSIPVARNFFKQLLSGVKYCHDNGIVHRDLKLENLILDRDGINLKICDFGHSSFIVTDWDFVQSNVVGSLYHIAPEQLLDHCYRGKKADIWSIGVILVRMLTGKYPFYSKDPEETVKMIKYAVYVLPDSVPMEVQQLLSHIFVIDPEKRYSIEQIEESSFTKCDVCMPFSFTKKTIIIDSTLTTIDNAWNTIHNILESNGVMCKNNTRSCYTMYCFHLKMQMKFVLGCRVGQTPNSNTYLEFAMTDGAGIDFRNFIETIRKQFVDKIENVCLILNEKSFDSLLLESSQPLLTSFRRSYEESVEKSRVSVLLCGKAGCGKTSLAQRFFSSNIEVDSVPTKYYTKYIHPHKSIVLYDAKGIEMKTKNDFWEVTRSFLEVHKSSERIHCVWYVVDATASRFDVMEEEICRTLFDIPMVIIINKADLLSDEELTKLKTKIESYKFEKCVGVVTTIGLPPEKVPRGSANICSRCKSDDICVFVKQNVVFCNACGYEQSIMARTNVDQYDKVIDLTISMLPDAMKSNFVSGQSLSITRKIETSKKLLREYYKSLGTNNEYELKRVLQLLTKLNKLWDMADFHTVKVASKVIQNFLLSKKDVGKTIANFFCDSPVFEPNEFTAVCVVWVQCLTDLHFQMIQEVLNGGKGYADNDALTKKVMDAFVKMQKNYVETVQADLTKNGIESVLKKF